MPPDDEPFFCPRHSCIACGGGGKSPSVVVCKYCPLAWCTKHRKTQVLPVPGVRFLPASAKPRDIPPGTELIVCQACSGLLDAGAARGLLTPEHDAGAHTK